MVVLAAFLIVIGLTAGFYPILDAPKGEVNLAVGVGGGVRVRDTVTPSSETNQSGVVKQSYDYSCGSAALATLLDAYLGEKFTEKQVIQGLLKFGDSEQIAKRRAFSLLDMKNFVTAIGYKGVGYKADLEDLKTLEGPCIVPIKIFDYRHFAVLKGIYKDHVVLADPWRGNISFTVAEFKDIWYENVIFMVTPEGGRELKAVRLREDDLRFVDEDAVRAIVSQRPNSNTLPEERRINEVPGTYQFYKQ